MKHFKVVVFAFVVAQCVFQGDGLPGRGNDPKKKCDLKSALLCGSTSTTSGESRWIGAGLTIAADGTVNGIGPNAKFTVSNLKEPLQAVTYRTFAEPFGLIINEQKVLYVKLVDVFADLLRAQSDNPQNGVINYETAILFLQMLDTVRIDTIRAMKIVCFLIKKNKEMNAKNKKFNFKKELSKAEKSFGGAAFVSWSFIEEWLPKAVSGDSTGVKSIADCVIFKHAVTRERSDYNPENISDWKIVNEAVNQVVNLAKLISSEY